MHKKLISIEGNIGVGKSTMINIIQKHIKNVKIIQEPLIDWQNIEFENKKINILDEYYKNPQKYAYAFQQFCFYSRHKNLTNIMQKETQNDDNKIYILERSIISDKYIFAKIQYQKGYMTNVEKAIYDNQYEYLTGNYQKQFVGFIYMQCDPDCAYKRIQKRNRNEEKDIDLQYIKDLHQMHEEWLNFENDKTQIINVQEDFENNINRQEQIINQIKQFIKKFQF